MSLSIGIVGLPNVGKSTLFNALSKAQNAEAANYPFCTIEPNKATVGVPDARLYKLQELVNPKQLVPATVDFIDIAGLVRGASKGEGLGNQFLANIRECTAIVHVVRCFTDENVTHVDGGIDPARDVETIETELVLADLQSVEKRLEKALKAAKAEKNMRGLADDLTALSEHLNQGKSAALFTGCRSETSEKCLIELSLLSAKPIIFCANVDEATLSSGSSNTSLQVLEQLAVARNAKIVTICAKIEEELQGLAAEEQKEILASYNITEPSLDKIIRMGYNSLGLISYFTAGEKEVRAWTITRGWKAPQAAGVIHTDFEKGFIRAEVISYDDYVRLGSELAARTSGVMRTEGREYVFKDGDVVHFLFNV
jgi:GTP-binding protein YchF